jgi:archaellum component FlaG (FlaF/FlaG flagellin family)
MPSDGGKSTQDKNNPGSDGADSAKDTDLNALSKGTDPSTKPGTASTSVSFIQTLFKTDKLGGGGNETAATRAARAFNDSLTKGTDMTTLEMEIIGDPYFIVQSGAGNYTAKPTQYSNLNDDGSINHQSGEVDILVNFRTPIDINQTTGLYDFSKGPSAPVELFSGLYMVRIIDSTFSKNEFKQVLHMQRRPLQELAGPGTTNGVLSTSGTTTPRPNPAENPPQATLNADGTVNASDPNGYGPGT